ncbi:MAG: RNA polymerase sigma factor [Acidimicrobiia bacterium]
MINDSNFPTLLAAAVAGDDDAMAVIFRSLHPRLRRFLHANEPRVADDLCGEVWMAVARGLASFDGDAVAFRSWVFSIARNRLADHRRQSMRRNTVPASPDDFVDLTSSTAGPDALVIDAMSGADAASMIVALLPADQAEVVLLRVLGELDVAEVASIMGRDANWVRVTQHRALRKLADRLGSKIDVMR